MAGKGWRRVRCWALVCVVAIVASGVWPFAAVPSVGAVRGWAEAALATIARVEQTATVLGDGSVLVAGGDPVGSAERYNPATDRWQLTGALAGTRYGHTATLLRDGTVLVVGGVAAGPTRDGQPALATAERYDPATGRWRAAGSLAAARFDHTATLLNDGRVFVAGGALEVGGSALASAEIYDPATDRWSPTNPFGTQRSRHTATLLPDGRVALAGGQPNGRARVYLDTVEAFDPPSGQWTTLPGGFGEGRAGHVAALLPNGSILIAGGASTFEANLRSVEYFPATGKQQFIARLNTPRALARAVAAPDGGIFLIGGVDDARQAGAVERYDPARHLWVSEAPLGRARGNFAAVALRDGELLVSGGTIAGAPTASTERYRPLVTPERCFAETSQCVRGPFAAYWEAHGGLAINGYPLTGERVETLEDGLPHIVQYFERTRLESHPANPAPYDVLLGQFGRRIVAEVAGAPTAQAAPQPGKTFFSETGHNVGGAFLAYWQGNGGLAQFGFPLTEEFVETLEDGKPYTVQYFERARFEYHPENADPQYQVLLGQFGRAIAAQAEQLTGAFSYLYETREGVRAHLGPPLAPATTVAGATLGFERGQMFYRADQRRIYVFGSARGDLLGEPGGGAFFADTWAEGQPVGGGPGPTAGLFVPARGFGKVWREREYVRARLGYALSADEASSPLLVQDFARGMLLLSRDGQTATALYLRDPLPCDAAFGCAPESLGSYQCFGAFSGTIGCAAPPVAVRDTPARP